MISVLAHSVVRGSNIFLELRIVEDPHSEWQDDVITRK